MIDSEKRAKFRQVLDGTECVHPGSVFDAISSRIAEDLGYKVGMFAGSIASASILGDLNSLNKPEEYVGLPISHLWWMQTTATEMRSTLKGQ